MATLNQCSFIGRLGKDPTIEVASEGKPYTKFSLTVDQAKDQDPLWLNITCWGELAETMERVEITATTIQLLDKAKKLDEQAEKE